MQSLNLDKIELNWLRLLCTGRIRILLFFLFLLILLLLILLGLQELVFEVRKFRAIGYFVDRCEVDQRNRIPPGRRWQPCGSIRPDLAFDWRADSELNAGTSTFFKCLVRVKDMDLFKILAEGNSAFLLVVAATLPACSSASGAMAATRLENTPCFVPFA